MNNSKLKIRVPCLRAVIPFVKKDAIRNMNIAYYKAYSRNMKDYAFIEREKRRRSTPRWDYVSRILETYTQKGFHEKSRAGKILQGIFNKNCAYTKGELPFRKSTRLLTVVSNPEMLWLAYKRLKGNAGILIPASSVSKETFNNYSQAQKEVYFRKKVTPDGFSLRDVYLVSSLIKRNGYPWGSSRRIWLDKPGSNKKRPELRVFQRKTRRITIPPFMDRLVQESIKMVLVAIWEPDFERMNRSFGFRPNKSCHDAMAALRSNHTIGLHLALEGDISAAYDNVRKEDAIACLEKKIKDRKFIRFMTSRLDYDYVDQKNKTRIRPSMGIPQGGIDSPYLFNIIFHELDKFVMGDVQTYLGELNSRMGLNRSGHQRQRNKARRRMETRVSRLKRDLSKMKDGTSDFDKVLFYNINKEIKILRRKILDIPYYVGPKPYRLFYVRYADDWIILTNAAPSVIEKIKYRIKDFLFVSLGAKLSEDKSVITDTRKNAAHFLGFEIWNYRCPKWMRSGGSYRGSLRRVSNFPPLFRPDRSRLINRFHTRGFCDQKGFPISISWLTGLEATVIIERYNASIRGLMTYYTEWISCPSDMNRWVYILRYSCLKTLAHKYKTTINKIMKRFGADEYSSATKTVEVVASITVGKVQFEKGYKLETYLSARDACMSQERRWKLFEVFRRREAGEIGNYPWKKDRPTVTHENFVDFINCRS